MGVQFVAACGTCALTAHASPLLRIVPLADRELAVPTVTLYGLPTCDTCRKARNWLDRFGVAYAFVDYRANPIPAADGSHSLYAAVVVKRVDEKTRAKTSINELLRAGARGE